MVDPIKRSDVFIERAGNMIDVRVRHDGKLYGHAFESNADNDLWIERETINLVDYWNWRLYGTEPSWEYVERDGSITIMRPPSGVAAYHAPS